MNEMNENEARTAAAAIGTNAVIAERKHGTGEVFWYAARDRMEAQRWLNTHADWTFPGTGRIHSL